MKLLHIIASPRHGESNTMSKLRHPSRSKLLRDYLD